MERSHLITNINDIVDLVGTISDYNNSFNDIVDLVRTMSDYNGSI